MRSVNVATVDDCPAASFSFIATPTTSELSLLVVMAGVTLVGGWAARSDEATVPSCVGSAPDHDRIVAADESPAVPVVSPLHVIVGASLVPLAIFAKTEIVPPLAVPLRTGNPVSSVHPVGVAIVAVFDLLS